MSSRGPRKSRRRFLAGSAATAGVLSIAADAGAIVSDSELAWMPAWRQRQLFRRRKLSPLEYARFLLDRIDKHRDLGAFLTVDAEREPSSLQYTAYTIIFNNSGHCAASVPVGFHQGTPVGLQIAGRPGDEALVLRAARALEREFPWTRRHPPL